MDLEQIKKKIMPQLKEAGITRAGIFGSWARGEQKKGSDLDILIQPPEGFSLFDLVALERKLKQAIHIDVDLVTYNSLHRLLKTSILGEEVRIL